MNGLLLFLIILNAYILLVYLAARSGLLARYNIGLMGPALMVRTQRGKGIIEWISKIRRFWIPSGTFGIWLTLGIMGAITLLLIVQIPSLFRIPIEDAPGARHILALPGINPLIPIGYGIAALIIAIVIHEFAHGVLARAQGMGVKSLGMLYLIVPIGAFVEPDEEELMASSRKKRMRVYAAGPTSNLVTALICGLIFSGAMVGAAEVRADGMGIVDVTELSPAEQAGIEPGWIITSINGTHIGSGAPMQVATEEIRPGQEVVVETHAHGTFTVCLADSKLGPDGNLDPEAQEAYLESLGAGFDFCSITPEETDDPQNATGFLGVSPIAPAALHQSLTRPFDSLIDFVTYIALPFLGLTPLDAPVTDFFTTPVGDGTAAALYWVVANLFYWIMWISLMLGLTNALPAVPLDGGFLFRDFVDGILARIRPRMSDERRAPIVKRTSVGISFLILGLILLQFLAPRIAASGLF